MIRAGQNCPIDCEKLSSHSEKLYYTTEMTTLQHTRQAAIQPSPRKAQPARGRHGSVTRLAQILILILCALAAYSPARAQCSAPNTAFQSGETLQYNLYFNWKFIWVKVGTATMNITTTRYKGEPAYRAYLITRGNKRADALFMLRDTLTAHLTEELTPLHYRKHAHEGKNFYREDVTYSYPRGTCRLTQRYSRNFAPWEIQVYEDPECAFDMVSMLLRARSFDPSHWKAGHRVEFTLAEGRKCRQEAIVFKGRDTFQQEGTGIRYRCLVFAFLEKKDGGKEKEIMRFYITDDKNHLPVRLDMNLNFGTAKAYLAMGKGLRNPQTSIIKKKK